MAEKCKLSLSLSLSPLPYIWMLVVLIIIRVGGDRNGKIRMMLPKVRCMIEC
jgi:hypothetical protein